MESHAGEKLTQDVFTTTLLEALAPAITVVLGITTGTPVSRALEVITGTEAAAEMRQPKKKWDSKLNHILGTSFGGGSQALMASL